MTTQVTVGMDDTPSSSEALRWGVRYASSIGGALRLVHVVDVEPVEVYGSTAQLRETLAQDARARLTQLATQIIGSEAPGTSWRLDVVHGPVGRTLVTMAKDADLLVIGTRDHVGVRRLLAGSVSHYCLAHSARPVVAVPAPPPEDRGDALAGTAGERR